MAAKTFLKSALTIFAILFLPAHLTFAAPPRYEIIDLGPGIAYGINEAGQVIGCYWTHGGVDRAFLWEKNAGRIDLGTLGGGWAVATAINDSGQVVGWSGTPALDRRAFLWDRINGMIDLGTLPSCSHSYARGINNIGQVVGESGVTAFLWEDGKMIDLGRLAEYGSSEAYAVNDAGQVVGSSHSTEGPAHAFLWDSINGMRDLGALPHAYGNWSYTYGINNVGQVVGISGAHVFLWQDGEMTDLGTLSYFSESCTINDAGQVVGAAEHYEGEYHAFYWDRSVGMIRLDQLVPYNRDWQRLESARDINNRGQIVGYGLSDTWVDHAFIMTPVPPMMIYVDDDAAGANDGSSWEDAYNFLQDALAAAYSGDEIHVAQGIYKPDQGIGRTPGDRAATFQLINGVTLKGGYAGFNHLEPNARDIELYETTLSGDLNSNDAEVSTADDLLGEPTRTDNSYHVVTGSDTNPTAILEGFTITGGNAPGSNYKGGGILNQDGSPTVINCRFTENFADGWGGGMCNTGYSYPTLTNCTFSRNSSREYGGGILNFNSDPTLINCILVGNSAGCGGGIHNDSGSPTLFNCVFSGNAAQSGGGMYNESASNPSLTNCTFSGNSGVAICTEGCPTVTNCIFWGNTDSNGMGEPAQFWFYDGRVTININYSCVQGWTGDLGGIGNIGGDPLFWDVDGADDVLGTEDDNLRLSPASPCIDTGDPNYIAGPNETDLDGKPRVLDGDNDGVLRVDMGAYEKRFAISAEARILPQTINLASKGNWITCYIWLPNEYDATDIEPNSVFLEDDVQPDKFSVDQQQQVATARFTREDIQPILRVGDVDLTITGQLTGGTIFEGTDVIKIIDKAGPK